MGITRLLAVLYTHLSLYAQKRGQTSNCPNLFSLVYLYFAETCHLQITEMMILLEFHHPFLNANLGETPKGYVKTVNKLLFSLTVVTV